MMEWFEPFGVWVVGLDKAYSMLVVLVIASLLVIISMTTNHLVNDVKRLGEHEIEVRSYTRDLNEARKKDDKNLRRQLKRRESEIRGLQSFITRQRMKVTLVTMLPFMIIYLILSSAFSGITAVAILPFELPLVGRELSFYLWYLFCYFTAYLPLSRVFGVSVEIEPKPKLKQLEKPDKLARTVKRKKRRRRRR